MNGRLFVDVSCVRIQRYLSRTTRLRGRRGASAAIAEATRFADGVCPFPGAALNAEAGEADGVVNLVVDGIAPQDADATARALAREVFRRLRRHLPAAEFQAVWGIGASYLDVHHHTIGPRLRRGDVLADLPPVSEVGYARVCELCHLDPAERGLRLGGGEQSFACPDCLMRFSPATRQEARTAERDLAEFLGVTGRAEDLTDLARLGAPDTDRNHIGTVFIDGNAFGEFFEQLATRGAHLDPGTKAEISRGLNRHTRAALEEAAFEVSGDDDGGVLCVVPHLVGGDDALISLPADRVWAFTRSYLREFGERAEATRVRAGVPDLPRLSASAGLVIAHAKEPFHLVVEEAARRLAEAKGLVRGRQASLAFADLTTGESGTAVRLADLEAYAERLSALAALPAATRHTLATMLRRRPDDTTALENRVLRLEHAQVVGPFLAEDSPIGLAQALRMARWWR